MHEQQNNTVNAKTAVDTASTSGVQRGPGALRAGLVQETFKSDIRIRFGRMDRIELNREGRTFRQQGPRCGVRGVQRRWGMSYVRRRDEPGGC